MANANFDTVNSNTLERITAAHAHRLIAAESAHFCGAAHGTIAGGGVDRYAERHMAAINEIVRRATARTEVIWTAPNGLRKIRAYDSSGEIVAEWTE